MTELEIPTDFKTSLPPRKRAKTKEEKEQRRIERILRNRKAAHASREKKRKHVEFLEKYVLDLEKQMSIYNTMNAKLLQKHYKGDDAEIDKLIIKIDSLPDLQQMKIDHHIELDEQKLEDFNFPRTPESFTSSSPKSNHEDFEVPELDSRNTSISTISELALSNDTPDSSPETTDKFSLDIIGGGFNINQPLFSDIFVKREEEDVIVPDAIIKKEDQNMAIPELSDTFLTKKENTTIQFPEQLSNFTDFQVNSFDNHFVFEELRNPAVITPILGLGS